LGVDGSGLHEHYAARLEQWTVLSQGDLAIAEIIVNFLPHFDRYDVLQAGLGELAFLLSAFGCRTTALDPFAARAGAIEAGIAYLRDCQFPSSDLLDSGLAVVPELTDSEAALAVALQLQLTPSPEEQEVMLTRLEKYRAVLFDPATLLGQRPNLVDQQALVERFRRAGFTQIKDYPYHRLVYCAKDDGRA
jgi:hypothetical protein